MLPSELDLLMDASQRLSTAQRDAVGSRPAFKRKAAEYSFREGEYIGQDRPAKCLRQVESSFSRAPGSAMFDPACCYVYDDPGDASCSNESTPEYAWVCAPEGYSAGMECRRPPPASMALFAGTRIDSAWPSLPPAARLAPATNAHGYGCFPVHGQQHGARHCAADWCSPAFMGFDAAASATRGSQAAFRRPSNASTRSIYAFDQIPWQRMPSAAGERFEDLYPYFANPPAFPALDGSGPFPPCLSQQRYAAWLAPACQPYPAAPTSDRRTLRGTNPYYSDARGVLAVPSDPVAPAPALPQRRHDCGWLSRTDRSAWHQSDAVPSDGSIGVCEPEGYQALLQAWSDTLRLQCTDCVSLALHMWRRVLPTAMARSQCSDREILAAALWLSAKILCGRRSVPPLARVSAVVEFEKPRLLKMEVTLLEWLRWEPLLGFLRQHSGM